MKDEGSHYPAIQQVARALLAKGERCSTELVAKAAGLTMEDTPVVFRALAQADSGLKPDWMAAGSYTTWRSAT